MIFGGTVGLRVRNNYTKFGIMWSGLALCRRDKMRRITGDTGGVTVGILDNGLRASRLGVREGRVRGCKCGND